MEKSEPQRHGTEQPKPERPRPRKPGTEQPKPERPNAKRPKVAVLFGGCSPEYGISLQSAYSVVTHFDKNAYELILLGITRRGEWFYFRGSPEQIRDDTWNNPASCVKAIISPDRSTRGIVVFEKNGIRSIRLDAALPILHGRNGEDGTLQGLLELAGIPVVGNKTLASALCMDKSRAHAIVKAAGIKVPRSFTIQAESEETCCLEQVEQQTEQQPTQQTVQQAEQFAEQLGYPLFVKPVNAGSSYGITKVFNKSELPQAVRLAFCYDKEIIIEENIPGFEVGCAVLENGRLVVGLLDEIELAGSFFDHKEKYTLETSAIYVPARISEHTTKEANEAALAIYRALGCKGFARVDMFITPTSEIVFNEVNTIPGFTAHSRYPNMLKAIGLTFEEVINTAIETALKK